MTGSIVRARGLAQAWRAGDIKGDDLTWLLDWCRSEMRALSLAAGCRQMDRVDLAASLGAALGLREGAGVDGVASVRLAKLAGYPDAGSR